MAIPLEKLLDAVGITDTATREKFKKYDQAFDQADTDGSRTLSKSEILSVLKSIKVCIPKNQTPEQFADNVIAYCNSDEDASTLTKQEFFKGLIGYDVKEAWLHVFNAADKDHSGKLNAKELQKLLEETKCSKYTMKQISRFIETQDTNKDGELDYHEFIENFILSGGHMQEEEK
ncbi:16 kDa calcium-binding protein-like [Tubulanus polymorphus]|uniref:16 kDa calcium-binding protein-like n=1 Tax=Tubulanus polymorphus TaxID=672921 RepID=UPI003DA3175A